MPVDIWVSNVCLPQNTPGCSINSFILYVKQQISGLILHFMNFLMWSARCYIIMEMCSRPFSKKCHLYCELKTFLSLAGMWLYMVKSFIKKRLSNQCCKKCVHVIFHLHLLTSAGTSMLFMAYPQYPQESTELCALFVCTEIPWLVAELCRKL